MSYDDSNVFAKILRGVIPSHKVYDDADAFAEFAPYRKDGHKDGAASPR